MNYFQSVLRMHTRLVYLFWYSNQPFGKASVIGALFLGTRNFSIGLDTRSTLVFVSIRVSSSSPSILYISNPTAHLKRNDANGEEASPGPAGVFSLPSLPSFPLSPFPISRIPIHLHSATDTKNATEGSTLEYETINITLTRLKKEMSIP